MIPRAVLPAPFVSSSFLAKLIDLPKSDVPLSPLTPLSPTTPPIISSFRTRVMGILNLTPDSFSDGGLHTADLSSLQSTLEKAISASISILDIGGQSTRPHSPQVSAEEELSRILPAIKSIRSQPTFNNIAISVDTYRSSVAAAAIAARANIINDVSAGQLDPDMLATVAKLGCTVVLMHMRGTPDTMTSLTSYPNGVINGVATELLERVAAAEKAGIRRWRIILDPGIGFAKNQAQNLELLRRFGELRDWEGLRGLPWVVGASRKGFIGKITGVKEASERAWGTAAAVTAAVKGGAEVVRVHDVEEMGQVAKMADAIWRV